jgi:hypothetical protein
MITNSLMKMVAVRAPRSLELDQKIDLTIPLESKFLLEVRASTSRKHLIALCDGFIRSDDFPRDGAGSEIVSILVAAAAFLAAAADPENGKIDPQAMMDFLRNQPKGTAQRFSNPQAIAIRVAEAVVAASYGTAASPARRDRLQKAARAIGVLTLLATREPAPAALLSAPLLLPTPGFVAAFNPNVRPAGVGELLVVREEWDSYHRDQVAHIENVMASETRDRNHRSLNRTKTVVTSETETTEETTRDLQSTERSELSTEISETVSNAMSIGTGLNISARYGPMLEVDASAEFSYDTAQEESKSVASSFAQEMVDKALSKIVERRKDTTAITTVVETEEINNHGFINTDPAAKHISGVYRYVNQRWKARIYNYGKRLLLEFVVPEPAANFLQAHDQGTQDMATLPRPKNFTLRPDQVNETTYLLRVAEYNATGVDPFPEETIYVDAKITLGEDYNGTLGGNDYDVKTAASSIPVPAGYVASEIWGTSSKGTFVKDKNDRDPRLDVVVGGEKLELRHGGGRATLSGGITGTLEVGVYAFDVTAAAINLKIRCTRTNEAYQAWQMSVYDACRTANLQDWAAYNAEQASLKNVAKAFQSGLAPDKKRAVEKDELKRGALTLLTLQGFDDYDAVDDPQEQGAGQLLHEIDIQKAFDVAPKVSFFEQAMEWEQMTYAFFPYFWGDKRDWLSKLRITDSDPVHEAFLKAGSSRVQVPVRPGFERAVLYYLATGEVWGGRDAPVIGSRLYVPIVEEIAAAKDVTLEKAEPFGPPWDYEVPTDLVILDPDASLIR